MPTSNPESPVNNHAIQAWIGVELIIGHNLALSFVDLCRHRLQPNLEGKTSSQSTKTVGSAHPTKTPASRPIQGRMSPTHHQPVTLPCHLQNCANTNCNQTRKDKNIAKHKKGRIGPSDKKNSESAYPGQDESNSSSTRNLASSFMKLCPHRLQPNLK